jgi:mRNA interferase MazF
MVVPSSGDVVVVPFPFSDLSQNKVRPAECLAPVGRGDWILCQITSIAYGDPDAVSISAADFLSGGLLSVSFMRPGKLFTANEGLLIRSVGTLSSPVIARLKSAVVAIIQR